MARRPASRPAGRPLISVSLGGPGNRSKNTRKRKRSNTAAVVRRLGVWVAVGAGAAVGGGARRAAATTGRVAARSHARYADVREARRVHGSKAVVRDADGGPPLSLAQVQSRLLGLDAARAESEGRAVPAMAQVIRPIDDETLRRAAAPIRLSRRDRRRLPDGWDTDQVHLAQALVTDHLAATIEQRPTHAEPAPAQPVTHLRPVPDLDTPTTTPARGTDTVIEPQHSADLTDPQIDPRNWQDELPAFMRALAQMIEREDGDVGQMEEYFRSAQLPGELQKAVEDVRGTHGLYLQAAQNLANATESWAAGLELPRFDRVS